MKELTDRSPVIGFDASSVVGQRTGIGYATASLLTGLGRIWPESWPPLKVWINSRRHEPPAADPWMQSPRCSLRRTHLPGRLLLRSWQHLDYPPAERLFGSPLALVHAPASYIPPVQHARRVVTVHDLYFRHAPADVETYGGGYFLKTFPKGLPRVDHIITVSEFTRSELLRFYPLDPERVTAIHLGVDCERFSAQPHGEDDRRLDALAIQPPYLLCVATIEPRKNLPQLIQGYSRMLQVLKAAHQRAPRLVITGPPGWQQDALRARVREAGLEEQVLLTGYVPDDVLPALYRRAFALIFPSIYEGFGMPVLEAMACGCPVVMARAGSLPEVGGECAIYFNPRSPDSIARALGNLVIEPHQREALRAAGLHRVRGFSWESTARATLEVYRRVLGAPVPPPDSVGVPVGAALE